MSIKMRRYGTSEPIRQQIGSETLPMTTNLATILEPVIKKYKRWK